MRARRCWAIAVALAVASPLLADVHNLRVVTDASPDTTDIDSLVASATSGYKTDAEKCWALWAWLHQLRRQTAPMLLHGTELTDPIRQFNDFGYTQCSTVAGINCALWDAMGYPVRFWDVTLHTVPEVFYDGRWHMYDNSMSALYTLCDGTTIAGVEDLAKTMGCAASGGKEEPGHLVLRHSLTATSPLGFLSGADDARRLADEVHVFNPGGLKLRTYYHNWERGHRYVLNLRDGESYRRDYTAQGPRWDRDKQPTPSDAAQWFVPNGETDKGLVDPDGRYGLRGNGVRLWRPDLARLTDVAQSVDNLLCTVDGIRPKSDERPGSVVFKIEGANVLTSLKITAAVRVAKAESPVGLEVSSTNGLTWQPIWTTQTMGEQPLDQMVVDPLNGSYEALVRLTLGSGASLRGLAFEARTMLNAKAQPQLRLGRNEVYVGAGDPTESIAVWPELQGARYRPYAVDEHNVASAPKNPGYLGSLYARQAKEDAWVTFRVDAPRPITRVTYGGRFYNRAPGAHIDLLHSFDDGRTWTRSWTLTDTAQPWDVLHEETVGKVPAGTRSVQFKYLLNASEAGANACSLYSVRMEVDHQPANASFKPLDVTFDWDEAQADGTSVKRSHLERVTKLPTKYVINVGGADHPTVRALRLTPATEEAVGYSDGKDPGGAHWVGRWLTTGHNLAEGRPYTVSVPSHDNWGAGDPDGKKLTDGVVGSSFPGGGAPAFGLAWQPPEKPDVVVDLGAEQTAAAFRIHLTAGWPWSDALRGEVKDKVEVFTSADNQAWTSQGLVPTRLWRKDVPVNWMLNDEGKAQGWNFELVPLQPVKARYVKYAIAPARILIVTEVQVLDALSYTPFDLHVTLPDAYPKPQPRRQSPGTPAAAASSARPRIAVPLVATPPQIDGRLDDDAWSAATASSHFVKADGGTSKAATRLLVCQDRKALYVAVKCFDDPAVLRSPRRVVSEHDGDGIWNDESVEFFLGPGGDRPGYYQIIVNLAGSVWDAWHDRPNHPDLSWNPEPETAVQWKETYWTVEAALPWSAFNRSGPPTSAWSFNVLRNRATTGEHLFWSQVPAGSAHVPECFGLLTGLRVPTTG